MATKIGYKAKEMREKRVSWLLANRHLWSFYPSPEDVKVKYGHTRSPAYNKLHEERRKIVDLMKADGLVCKSTYAGDINLRSLIRDALNRPKILPPTTFETWTVEHSWDQLIKRLDELERTLLPYKSVWITTKFGDAASDERREVIVAENDVFFSYQIARFYTAVKLSFSNGGHPPFYPPFVIASACVVPDQTEEEYNAKYHTNGRVFPNKKEAAVYVLNTWEHYMATEGWKKDRQEFEAFIKECES